MKQKLAVFVLLALLIVGIVPAVADTGAYWSAQYFNNPIQNGAPAFSRTDSAIAFNWGAGTPGVNVPADNFSVRWESSVFLNRGTYRFWALADDNLRVTLDFNEQPIIDTFSGAGVGQIVSTDVTLDFGVHNIRVDYRENAGNAYVYFAWADLATNPTGPSFPIATQPSPVIPSTNQWIAQYYNNPQLSGNPISTAAEVSPSHNWGLGAPAPGLPADNFSARWTSQQTLGGGGYRLSVRADDGVRVYVDGVAVINEWHNATDRTYTADLNLSAGQHYFVVEYYDLNFEAFLNYSLEPVSVPTAVPNPGVGGQWVATYWNNRDLRDTPAAILTEVSPSHNWGSNAPFPSIGADDFSARWTTVQTIPAGNYRISVRADDGVRVYVDGVLVINEWHNAEERTYTYDLFLAATPHTFTIEYFEAGGVAFIDYNIGPATAVSNTPTPIPANPSGVDQPRETGARATVSPYVLNLRSLPSTQGSSVLLKLQPGETHSIVGRTPDSAWWQLNVNGTLGWAFSNFVTVSNTGAVPITYRSQTAQPAPSGYDAVARADAIIRSGPGTRNAVLGNLRSGQRAQVVGRNGSARWWQINLNGVIGWVSADTVTLTPPPDISRIPVTG